MTTNNLSDLTDDALLAETKRVAEMERRAMAELLTLLIEVERRHLCEKLGYPSLFVYCTKALGLSEQAAYSRITAARTVRRVPAMLPMLAEGALTLTSVGLLAPHLTDENQDALLAAAQHQSSRVVEKIVASVCAQPDIESSIRAVAAVGSVRAPISPKSIVAPIAPARFVLKVTISREAHDDLERARALLRHVIPSGDPAAIVERALALLVKESEKTKFAAKSGSPRRRVFTDMATSAPSNSARAELSQTQATRAVSAAVKRAVWARDQGRCAFVGSHGRCGESGFLEFHHLVPFADGGEASVENLQLRCRAHNAFEAREYFGAEIGVEDDLGSTFRE